mmetsp:Transcript_35261/g.99407  ORF Transcript_35261/g.99407 Transcript_35261/m.99407 type:complete len:153 (-) Transcript_35261:37-495(-)|eukprot:CAMPEP_0119118262 /NCGR_PEP_ID=MMETSP1310-20130426/165_1 /TAXON_ID=464262 /ORGANISM="Genus nov. species nov., Strain RCC2339" /LENGTH=152 /DNA_ID=CAMNT_0007107601 /DNA_START=71 /DNA_END=529 /DNA_ORIENTATION=+
MAGGVNKRLQKEYNKFTKEPPEWAKVSIPNESNMLQWKATMTGPEGTPYENGIFVLDIKIPQEYPFKPPDITFVTKVFHPNIDPEKGLFCETVLRERWSPQLTIHDVLVTLRNLLSDPNLDSPLNSKAGQEYRSSKAKFEKTAREWTKKYAK